LEITNAIGQVVYKENVILNKTTDKDITLPANTPAGVYQLSIISSDKRQVLRFTVAR